MLSYHVRYMVCGSMHIAGHTFSGISSPLMPQVGEFVKPHFHLKGMKFVKYSVFFVQVCSFGEASSSMIFFFLWLTFCQYSPTFVGSKDEMKPKYISPNPCKIYLLYDIEEIKVSISKATCEIA